MLTTAPPTLNPRFSRLIVEPEVLFRPIIKFMVLAETKKSVLTQYGKAADRSRALGTEVEQLLRHLRVEVKAPVLKPLGIEDDVKVLIEKAHEEIDRYCTELAACFDHKYVGRITECGEKTCRINWCEFEVKRGIVNRKVKAIEHTHDLTGMRLFKLGTSAVEVPPKAQKMIRSMNLLRPYAQLVAGTLNAKSESVIDEISERTALGRVIDRGQQAGQSLMRRLGDVAAIPLAATDPALLIGNRVLVGWE